MRQPGNRRTMRLACIHANSTVDSRTLLSAGAHSKVAEYAVKRESHPVAALHALLSAAAHSEGLTARL